MALGVKQEIYYINKISSATAAALFTPKPPPHPLHHCYTKEIL